MVPGKKYDLEERTEKFSLNVRDFCVRLKKDTINLQYIKQLVRSAGSIAANYIEANDNLGANDLKMRIRICRKEAKETMLWLKHVIVGDSKELEDRRAFLLDEASQLMNIFGAILKKLS
jgi:four helix bundle protein